jgi:FkbM family methyltransferase
MIKYFNNREVIVSEDSWNCQEKCFNEILIKEQYAFIKSLSLKTIIDAGGNEGYSAIYFASKFPNAKIITIEPEIKNYEVLVKNTLFYPNIITLNNALYSEEKDVNIIDPNYGKWGYRIFGNGKILNTIKTITIEKLIENYNLEYVDFLKIDIEGSEKEVLENCENWIDKIKIIWVEDHERFYSGCIDAIKNTSKYFNSMSKYGEGYLLRKN